jgi:predicted nucleic acid-binding protein
MIARGALVVGEISSRDVKAFAAIMETYADREVDLADASLVLLAEHLGTNDIVTTDRADFSVYRLSRKRSFNILFP